MKFQDTIAAISTPPGRGGIGVVRLSGPSAREICASIVSLRAELYPRHATLGELRDDEDRIIDEVVVTSFPAPHSATGDDVVEISCHGAPVILRHALERAIHAGARLADPGEFTLRAFLNGRIDLPQAEAVRDLIDATTLYQARIAAQQAQGSVSRRLAPIKAQLRELIALLEAGIDFAEDDVSVASSDEILRRLNPLLEQTSALARSFRYGNLVRSGFSLAIVGPPNAGKSSLFNRLLKQDRAIVTEIPGTTRDVVSETAELSGIPVRFMDTAGIRDAAEPVERLGVARSFEAMADADLTIVVIDGATALSEDARELIEKAYSQGRCLIVVNKCDISSFLTVKGAVSVSALNGEGFGDLQNAILEQLAPRGQLEMEGGFITSLRQEKLLAEAVTMLEKAKNAASAAAPHELLILDLYCALTPIDGITGATTADDILNHIFNTFCIGK